jgi:non-homologous end joining protein Ku
MAKQLVQSMEGKFTVSKFKDTYRADLKRRVQDKIRKKEIHALTVPEPEKDERPKAQVLDLTAALKASLGNTRRPDKPKPSKSSRTRKSA